MTKYFAALLMFLIVWPSFAADQNGYTARYTRSIGSAPQCDAVINGPNDANWSKLNSSSYRVICLLPGDYTGLGTVILNSSGQPGGERWLRYYSKTDNGSHPVQQAATERVVLRRLVLSGANNWIIDRITVDGGNGNTVSVEVNSGSSNNTFNRMLVEHGGRDYEAQFSLYSGDSNTVQYSVSRSTRRAVGVDNDCFLVDGATNTKLVNNEAYGCHSKALYIAPGGGPGTIVENNDFYVAPEQFTDCNGNFTPNDPNSPCAAQKALISIKNGGAWDNPIRIIHNRLWNSRATDTNVCCGGGGSQGQSVSISNASDLAGVPPYTEYVLFQNNIVTDGQLGIQTPRSGPQHNSIIGNLLYNIKPFTQRFPSSALDVGSLNSTEIYLNTIVNTTQWAIFGGSNQDVRCNVVVNGGTYSGAAGSGTTVEYNAFYNSSKYATSGATTTLVAATAADAMQENFCFSRKLITGAEQYCIPQAKPTSASPHIHACDTQLGSRTGIGINDILLF